YNEALDFFEVSVIDPKSCFYLGILYKNGFGVEKDLWEAKNMFESSFEDFKDESDYEKYKKFLPISGLKSIIINIE
ncbi:12228_t:CDS:1, partial [Dentiscutata erythropus]